MNARRTTILAATATILLGLPLSAQWTSTEKVDLDAIYRIKEEGFQRSKVMEIESYLTDIYGPRLTGSPNYKEAGDWAVKTMKEWGLANVHTESFPAVRGWQTYRFVANAVEPRAYPLIGFPRAWTPGTKGMVTGEAVLATIQNDEDINKHKGKLKGKFVLATPVRDVPAHFEALGRRYTAAELETLARQPSAVGRGGPPVTTGQPASAAAAFARKLTQFWVDEGVAAVLEPGRMDGGTMAVLGGGQRNTTDPPTALLVVLAVEHYGRIARTLAKNIPVKLEMDVDNRYMDGAAGSFNVIAEIPGTDKADEVVMVGAHFDSWHSATGATDNAAGSAVMMEALRILKAANIKLRRTVRVGLWGGEEQGYLGSRQYVRDHFGDSATMQLKPDHAKLSAYYNVDNGTGTIRGVYQQGNEAVAPIFAAWMEPFKNLGMTALTIRNTGGTDHTVFDGVGLPGFQFIQDPIEYDTRTHHTNMDFYERVQPQDMMNNAVIVASFVAHTANREDRLPRKPLPAPSRRP